MNRLWRLRLLGVDRGRLLPVVLALLVLGGCQTPVATSSDVSLLYTLTAGGGTLEPKDGGYLLTLSEVDSRTTLFADRPSRYASVVQTEEFVATWSGLFGDDPPNAALVLDEPTEGTDTLVVTLANPGTDAAGRLSFDVVVLSDENVPDRLAGFAGNRFVDLPTSLGRVSLFIDDADGTVINGCLIQHFAQCWNANLAGADLAGSDISQSQWTNPNFSGANLSGVNLSQSLVAYANFTGANLTGANLSQSDFSYSNFTNANLTGVNMFAGSLNYATLTGANLTNATISASLHSANLSGAIITGTNFDRAQFCRTTMPDGSDSGCGITPQITSAPVP